MKEFISIGKIDSYLQKWCFENNILKKPLWETLPWLSIELLDEKSGIVAIFRITEINNKYYLNIDEMNKWLKLVRKYKKKGKK